MVYNHEIARIRQTILWSTATISLQVLMAAVGSYLVGYPVGFPASHMPANSADALPDSSTKHFAVIVQWPNLFMLDQTLLHL